MSRYTVNLYDKDNDHFTEVLSTDNKEQALNTCEGIGLLLQNTQVIIRRNDSEFGITHDEPFDWVEVYDNTNKEVVIYRPFEYSYK